MIAGVHRSGARGRLVLPLIAGIVGVVGGCADDPVAPLDRVRVMAVVSVAGDPLPVALASNPDATIELLADTLRFDGEGLFERNRVVRTTGISGIPVVETWSGRGAAVVEGRRIQLISACPARTWCVPGETLVEEGGGFRSLWALVPDSLVTVRYQVLEIH